MSFCVGRAKSGAVAKKIFRACLLWCCAAATVEACAWWQSAVDGAIGGFVVDGAALVGAVVQVQNVADGTMTRATTEGKVSFWWRICLRENTGWRWSMRCFPGLAPNSWLSSVVRT
jgi:hypothetical protein